MKKVNVMGCQWAICPNLRKVKLWLDMDEVDSGVKSIETLKLMHGAERSVAEGAFRALLAKKNWELEEVAGEAAVDLMRFKIL